MTIKLQEVLDRMNEDDRIFIEERLMKLERRIEELELELDLMEVRPKRRQRKFDDEDSNVESRLS